VNQGLEQIWAEILPDGCPPPDAEKPNNEAYFRLVDAVPPAISDFQSTRALYPERKVRDECIARSVSIFGTEDRCKNAKLLPALKGKEIFKIQLPPESGLVKETGRDHYSWWRLGSFDIVGYCKEPA